ncbi:MAG TPA: sugar ABC transporter ATP-binding protein [Ilumatobacteraceae bacterium]|nr:sugar ABC transporter ATP-binding protein [Ilumatobacteraceae bacterium]
MPALLKIEHLSKVFPGQVALDDVDLTIEAGTTHALVGQNGSGKSTLIKILAGYHQPTGSEGRATYYGNDPAGEPLELGDGRAAERDGVRFVHQDLGLVEALTTVENLALGDGFTTRFGKINWRANVVRARRALAAIGFESVDVKLPVGTLAPAQKTGVALARALLGWEHDAHLLVLDEPTASLPARDVRHLFEAIRRLKERGVAILYVSHHLDEVFEIADEVSVLRDGRRIATERVESLDHDRLIELMIGHKIVQGRSGAGPAGDEVLVDVRALHGANLHGVDLQVRAGEVVGVAGITGSGRESLLPLLTGQVPSSSGSVEINGHFVDNYSPGDVLRAGGAFVTADRKGLGVFALMSVVDNTTICDVGRNARHGRLDKRAERADAGAWIDRLSVKTATPQAPIGTLSGGNQQKVLFARGLRLEPQVLMLDEPTQGIDVGAKEEIHLLIDRSANEGAAVVVASTDTDELVRVATRVVVMRNGHIVTELEGDAINSVEIERAQLAITDRTGENSST